MDVIIDEKSGFCFGVKRAIELAENEVLAGEKLFCLGEIVHNTAEVERLREKGIEFIDRQKYYTISNCKVLIRAHGEPPETYQYALENNIKLLDATCTVVLRLQEKVKSVQHLNPEAQIVIYGKKDHPEIIGLRGQVKNTIIVESLDEISCIDYTRPVTLFAQTTKDKIHYAEIKKEIQRKIKEAGQPDSNFVAVNSICGQVANRAPWLAKFSKTVDVLIFVGGKSSSNSKVLFEVCHQNNPNSYFIIGPDEVRGLKLLHANRVGITGATSTPSWLIDSVADQVKKIYAGNATNAIK
jgi:4-hydroxy-3-methylbut-2-en-1-yl diphosphate reductase